MRVSDSVRILSEVLLLVAGIIIAYGTLVIVSLLIYPPPSSDRPIDTLTVGDTVFSTDPKLIYLNRSSLERPGQKLVLLGASNALVGLHRDELQQQIPGYTVYGMGVGSANITEMRQVLHLAMSSLGARGIREARFVVGVWYGTFAPNALIWQKAPTGNEFETDIDRERYRYGFSARSPNGPVERFPDNRISTAVLAIYPLIAFDHTIHYFTDQLRMRYLIHRAQPSEDDLNHRVMPTSERSAQLAYFRTREGPSLSDEQFTVLNGMISDITAAGGKILLVSLPIPHWHAAASIYQADYKRRLSAVAQAHKGRPDFGFLDLSNLDDDDDFYDEVHPRPRVRGVWERAVAREVNVATATP